MIENINQFAVIANLIKAAAGSRNSGMVDHERMVEVSRQLGTLLGLRPGMVLEKSEPRLGYYCISKVKDVELSWNDNEAQFLIYRECIKQAGHRTKLYYNPSDVWGIQEFLEWRANGILVQRDEETWQIQQKNLKNEETSEPA